MQVPEILTIKLKRCFVFNVTTLVQSILYFDWWIISLFL